MDHHTAIQWLVHWPLMGEIIFLLSCEWGWWQRWLMESYCSGSLEIQKGKVRFVKWTMLILIFTEIYRYGGHLRCLWLKLLKSRGLQGFGVGGNPVVLQVCICTVRESRGVRFKVTGIPRGWDKLAAGVPWSWLWITWCCRSWTRTLLTYLLTYILSSGISVAWRGRSCTWTACCACN